MPENMNVRPDPRDGFEQLVDPERSVRSVCSMKESDQRIT